MQEAFLLKRHDQYLLNGQLMIIKLLKRRNKQSDLLSPGQADDGWTSRPGGSALSFSAATAVLGIWLKTQRIIYFIKLLRMQPQQQKYK